ncbi:MAG: hypothetical protein M0R47_16960 [Methylobacter sp.]|uniref:hypothetical protein n=1 Tax=Methylobacter sp. TaxID=2051955 RepID=UPI0025DD71D7|nr:hypothetical protein [Methylobacter sp.]MCK9622214.1 hypothetical protein [Methylobacter sp.]
MKNTITDLNNHLFATLERLNSEEINPDAMKVEIEKAKAISGIAKDITSNYRLALDAQIAIAEYGIKEEPKLFGLNEKNKIPNIAAIK